MIAGTQESVLNIQDDYKALDNGIPILKYHERQKIPALAKAEIYRQRHNS